MIKKLKSLFWNEEGATMVEYGLMIALIAAVCVGIVSTLGGQLEGAFEAVSDEVGGAVDD
ncbi:MAG TPA: Flp family type IVb pilin [Desulfotomaculum sp.]|nr:MAG: hypothetical protein JL56_04290 [Desulfotomaculum sp. BICA1-6]HBX24063.1 Flp family type IVb pilin [Desulfotomaculum sp.]